MSNALRRKKKPTFYTKQEMRIIGRNDFEKRNADKVIAKSYKDFVVIGYIILHDKFGFGQTRIIRLQDFLKSYLDEVASGGNTGKDLSVYLKSKYGIDIKEEVGKIPQRQLMNLYAKKGFCIEREAYRLSSASLFNYFALTLTILKKEFKITVKQLQYFSDKFIDYIDTLANYKQFQLTVPMIAETLADEIKFICDLEVYNMKNKEKYAKEILDIACAGDNVAMRKSDNVVVGCKDLKCSDCAFNTHGKGYCNDMIEKWANSEYVEPPVDWSKVAVDTPILVRDHENCEWTRRHFAKIKNVTVFAWRGGATSWSEDDEETIPWKYAKLAESEE